MLKTIDRHILKNYFKTFGFTILIFILISSIIDFGDKFQDYVEENIPTSEIIFDYTIQFMVHISAMLLPLYVLISVIFFTSRMAYNSEIISIFNAGASYTRFLRPYFVGGAVIVILHLVGNHFLFPLMSKSRLSFERTYIWKESDKGKTRKVHFFVDPNTKVFINNYNKKDSIAYDFYVEFFKDGNLVKLIKANQATCNDGEGSWTLKNYEVRTFEGKKETYSKFIGNKLDTTLLVYPEDFVQYHNVNEELISTELLKQIDLRTQRGQGGIKALQVEFYRRTAEPFTSLILTIIAVAIASRKVRGGIGVHLALGILIGVVYIFLSKFAITFAQGETIPPWLGIWVPNMIFAILAIFLITKAQK